MRSFTIIGVVTSLALVACSSPQAEPIPEEQSVRPGVNKRFLSDELTIDGAKKLFEVESREIFAQRFKMTTAMEIEPGSTVADIGAGTGLFTPLFAKKVGASGKVLAVDLSPKFVEHLRQLAQQKKLDQVEVVQCTDRDCALPAGAADLVFICDTYHHFEYPATTMASIHRGMKPGGRLVIVDFERIEGKSRKWVLGHVRCGKGQVIREVEAAGFTHVAEKKVQGLRENYFIVFTKK